MEIIEVTTSMAATNATTRVLYTITFGKRKPNTLQGILNETNT